MWTSTRWSRIFFALILTAWVCVVAGNASVALAAQEQRDTQSYQGTPAKTGQNSKSVTSEPSKGPTSQKQGVSRPQWYQDPQWIMVGIVGIYTLATISYAVFAAGQWSAIRRQAIIAGQTLEQVTRSATGSIESAGATRALFRATHRPRLVVRNVVVDEPDIASLPPNSLANPDLLFTGQAYIVNVGGSVANLKESGCWVFTIAGELPMRLPYEGREANNPIAGVDLASGTIGVMQFRKLKNELMVGGKAWDRAVAGEPKNWNTYLMGWLMYVDGANIVRATAFCRQWDIDKQRFVPVDNPDYENAD